MQRFLIENPTLRLEEEPRLLYFDLETERVRDWEAPWHDRILSISCRAPDGRPARHYRLEARTDQAERAMLQAFLAEMATADILLAWNGDRFDFPMLKSRMSILGIPLDHTGWHWLDHLQLFKKSYQGTDGAALSSYSLDHVGSYVVGKKKVPIADRARGLGWDGRGDMMLWCWERAPELLREYNDEDVELMVDIEAKTQLVYLHLSLCRLCRVLPDEWSKRPMRLIDGRMFQRGFEAGYHFPSRFRTDEEPRFQQAMGAFVPEAVVGLHESVAVVDYSRMYPSIILTFNMSLETLDPGGDLVVPKTDPQGQLTGEEVARFRSNPEGHLPVAIRGVLRERKQYETRRSGLEVGSPEWRDADTLSTACKVLANSFYGVLLSPFSRYFEPRLGESVTSVGRLLLANTMAEVQSRGLKFVFGDTDSNAFVATDEQARAVRDAVNNEMVPRVLAPTGARPGEIAIDYEKRFSKVLVTASKKYAGRFAVYKGKPAKADSPMAVKGLEMIRTDCCAAARSLQKVAVEMILDGEPAPALARMVEEAREDVMGGKVPWDRLKLSKAMMKDPGQYDNKPVQAKVAEKMLAEGMQADVGSKIPFYLTVDGPVHPDALDPAKLDLRTYWDDQIYPATLRCLEAAWPGAGWERLHLPKNYNANQPELFGRVNFNPAPVASPVPEPEKSISRGEGLVLVMQEPVDEQRGRDIGARVRSLVEAFPGDIPAVLWIRTQISGGTRMVEIDAGHRVRSPEADPVFRSGLRTLNLEWRWREDRAS